MAKLTDAPRSAHHHTAVETAFVVEQIRETTETVRASMISVVTFSTVLAVVNASLVGYAVNERLAGLLVIGPIFPVTMMAAVLMIRRMLTPMVYTAITIEHRFGGDEVDWLGTTYVAAMFGRHYVDRVIQIGHIDDPAERMRAVAANPLPIAGTGRGILRGLLALVTLGQPIAALVLWRVYDWQLF